MTADEDRKKAQKPELPDLEDTELHQLFVEASENSLAKSLQLIGCMLKQEINYKSKKTGNTYLHILVQVGNSGGNLRLGDKP